MIHHPFYYLSMLGLFLASCGIAYFAFFTALPFEFYVEIEGVEVSDMCTGDYRQLVKATRTPRWQMPGSVDHARIIRIEDQQRIETTIIRGPIPFIYEDNNFAKYEIGWNSLVEVPGQYTYDELQTIRPLPLIKRLNF